MEYKEVSSEERMRWDSLATHPLQSFAWSEFRQLRQPISRLGGYEDNKLRKIFLIVWTKLPGVNLYFGYVPMGVVPNEMDIEALRCEAIKHKAIGIRFEPNEKKGTVINLPKGRNLFKPKTYWWDLTKSEEELLKAMHSKARYNIKVAKKHGVIVNEDDQGMEKYLKLLFEGTVKRQKVGMHDEDYHMQMKKSLGKMARLFTATYKKEVLSAMMVYLFKDRAYYAYGANSLDHKKVMASTVLLWEVVKKMKDKNMALFDLWGAEEGTGFSRFKEQFGAELVEMVGAYDLVVKKISYYGFRLVEEARWKIRNHFK